MKNIKPESFVPDRWFCMSLKRFGSKLCLEIGGKIIEVQQLFDSIKSQVPQCFRGGIVFSTTIFKNNIQLFDSLVSKQFSQRQIYWALKSAPIQMFAEVAAKQNIGIEVASHEELTMALNAGVPGSSICHSAAAKYDWDIDAIVKNDCVSISDNLVELALINDKSKALGCKKTKIALRINPAIASQTSSLISTGTATCKFGIPDISNDLMQKIKTFSHLDIMAVHMHIGSQIADPDNYCQALKNLIRAYRLLLKHGFVIHAIDVGGGFPYSYRISDDGQNVDDHGHHANLLRYEYDEYLVRIHKTMVDELGPDLPTIAFEPGRLLTAGSAVTLGYVLHTKEYPNNLRWALVSISVNDLWVKEITPEIYFNPLMVRECSQETLPTAIGGTLCYSGDIITPPDTTIAMPIDMQRDDVVVFEHTGAYTLLGAGTFHNMPRLPVFVLNDDLELVREVLPQV
ncbi:MAG: Orn/DAP/Arg decarboxylase 2 [uncultured bacterium]|nr:MAG: Orn/DAP/Arg decarboxylase 2 [uncultured bacterium]HLD45178.1 hypothetical protein [bacterium]